MATVTARKVDDRDYALLSEAAAAHGRSISEEVRLMIAERARKLKAEKHVAEFRRIRALSADNLGEYPDSVDLLRAVRDEE